MTGRFHIKKFRRQDSTGGTLPLFISKRSKNNKETNEAYQVRYGGICKTFPTVEKSITFTEKILNNQLEDIVKTDIIISSEFVKEENEIRIVTKGIDRDEPYFFSEKIKKNVPLQFQIDTFESSCYVMWKLYFMKFNTEYRLTLLRKNWIGNTHVNRPTNHLSTRVHAKTPIHSTSKFKDQLFR
jgi:hypothetical protein